MTGAAVAHQIPHGFLHVDEMGAVDDRSAATLGHGQPSARKHRKMRRHGVVRHRQLPGDFSCRQTIGFMAYKQAKSRQSGFLGKRRKAIDGICSVHMSKNIDMSE